MGTALAILAAAVALIGCALVHRHYVEQVPAIIGLAETLAHVLVPACKHFANELIIAERY